MAYILVYISFSNDATQNCCFGLLQLEVETFRHKTNQLKFDKSPQSCQANE